MLRTHGITKNTELLLENHGGWYYEMHELGFNYRIPDVLCALGITQLKKFPLFLEIRKKIDNRYNNESKKLNSISIQNPDLQEGHVFHLYIIHINKRKELYDFLRQKNIFAQVHYLPVYRHPYYQKFMNNKIYCENAEKFYQTCLTLPIFPGLSEENQDYIISSVKEFISLYEK